MAKLLKDLYCDILRAIRDLKDLKKETTQLNILKKLKEDHASRYSAGKILTAIGQLVKVNVLSLHGEHYFITAHPKTPSLKRKRSSHSPQLSSLSNKKKRLENSKIDLQIELKFQKPPSEGERSTPELGQLLGSHTSLSPEDKSKHSIQSGNNEFYDSSGRWRSHVKFFDENATDIPVQPRQHNSDLFIPL